MAEEQFGTILTTIGKAKIANAALLGNSLVLKTLKIGDSNGQYYEPVENQTELKHEVYSCDIGSIKIDKNNPNWVKVETILSSSVGGFTIREVGICDADGDLVAISKYPATYKPIIENGAGKDICIRLIVEVSNAENVTLNLDPSVIIATKEDIDDLQKKIDSNTSQLKDLTNDSYPIVEATGTNAYVGSSARIKSVGKGTRCTLFIGTPATGNCSLNLNNTGAVAIKDSNGNTVTNLKANIPYNLCHNGSDFILQGKGGGGNLIAKYLLSGYYGEGDNGRVDGAMVNRGAPTANLNCGGTYNLQEGYYSGGKVTANSLATQMANGGVTLTSANQLVNGVKAYSKTGELLTGNTTIQSLGGKKYKSGVVTHVHGTHDVIDLGFKPGGAYVVFSDTTIYKNHWFFYAKETLATYFFQVAPGNNTLVRDIKINENYLYIDGTYGNLTATYYAWEE